VDGYYDAETVDGMDVLIPDLAMNSQLLQNYIYGAVIDGSKKLQENKDPGSEAPLQAEMQPRPSEGTEQNAGDAAEPEQQDTGNYGEGEDYSYDDGSYGDNGYQDEYGYGSGDGDAYGGIIDLDNDGYDDNTGYYYWGG
jgi:hypothetical protein